MFECSIAPRRSVAVLGMMYKIRYDQMHPLYDALPEPYVPVQVTRCALVADRFTYAPPCCRTSHYRNTIFLSVSLSNDLGYPVCDGVGLASLKSRTNDVLLACRSLFVS